VNGGKVARTGDKRQAEGTRKPTLISLFTGAGGLDLGLEAAGFDTRVCVEMDKDCVQTLRHNRRWSVIDRDIHSVTPDELLDVAGLAAGDADLLAGGPPCQPFSKSAYWARGDTKRLEDPRASTLGEYMRMLEAALPKAFLLENVFGLTYEGKDEGMVFLRETLAEISRKKGVKYSFFWKVLNTAKYGVPQIRERVFLIGCREGQRFEFPDVRFLDPASEEAQSSLFDLYPYRTAWDAIGDLDGIDHGDTLRVGGRWAALLPSIPEGENYLWHSERGGGQPIFRWRSRYWSMLLKLAKNRPSWTIQAQPGSAIGPFHWKNRRLSAREMCRIQTFPDDYEILGGVTTVQRQLGNAVPSAMAEVLGLEIRRQILGNVGIRSEPTLIPPYRAPYPDPEPLATVPDSFLEGIGFDKFHRAGAA
jgi:DNA (cytosine-5)-methyltransferase 1